MLSDLRKSIGPILQLPLPGPARGRQADRQT